MMRFPCFPVLIVGLAATFFSAQVALAQHPAPTFAQREFTTPAPLLDEAGNLAAWGWARRGLFQYNRDAIPPARQGRIKEWEHYTIMSPGFTVGVTIVQLGSLAVGSAELIDYQAQSIRSTMFIAPAAKEKALLPADPYGRTRLAKGDDFVAMEFADARRTIHFHFAKTAKTPAVDGRFELVDDPRTDSVAITRPLGGPGEFFYENKIFGMPATGAIEVDGAKYALPADGAWAIFDWGRGIWPHESQWFWGQAAGKVGASTVAINLGHGYGDDAHGTCNAILVDGRLHKLAAVDCQFDAEDRRQPWRFTSTDGRVDLTFQPIYQQHSKQDAWLAAAELYKIHGHYTGTLTLDDGTRLEVKNLLGFAEHMKQRW